MAACLEILGADLEQLVWQDIQSTALDKLYAQAAADSGASGAIGSAAIPSCQVPSASPTASSMSDHDQVSAMDALPHASGDAGSGSSVFALASCAAPSAVPAGSPVAAAAGDMGPFAALGQAHRTLSAAPSSDLQHTASLVTHKTRALAAAAGSLRTGAVGSGLRLAALMCRSNSGGLADALMAEQVRAESGLLTAGVARSDSVPEMGAAPSVADLAELVSLRDLDFLAGMPSAAGLPSLSMLFGERPDFSAAQDQPQQQPPAAAPAAAPATDAMWEEAAAAAAAPAWVGGGAGSSSRVMARPPSFNANSAAALFGGAGNGSTVSSALQLPARPSSLFGLPLQATGLAAAPLQPPSLVDYSQLLALSTSRDNAPAGFDGLAAAARLPLLLDRQDTFEVLMRQVDQELMAEAGIRQYAALEIDTMDVPLAAAAAAAAAPPSGALFSSTGMGAAATEVQAPAATRKRRSVFEGQATLLSSDVSAVTGADAAGTPVLDTVGPSFGTWVPPGAAAAAGPSSSSQASGATGGGVTPSPFCLPVSTGLQLLDGGDGAATTASAGTESGSVSALGKQEVARYKRLITCKTYLKRLNITQPMAEHLLPQHDLSLVGRPRTSADGSSDGEDGSRRGGSSYDQLFKEQVVLVDDQGGSFRVQYEGVACNAQKHLRLTCGWRDYIRQHNVEVGDTVVFERRGHQRSVIYVTLVKAADAPVELAPEGKRRRVTRKEAVQRLQ